MSIIDVAINEIKKGQEKGYKPNYAVYINEKGERIILKDKPEK